MTSLQKLLLTCLIAGLLSANAVAQSLSNPFSLNQHSATGATTTYEYLFTDSLFYNPGAVYQLVHRNAGATSWLSQSMNLVSEACSAWTISTALTYMPPSDTLEYYFRAETDTLVVSQSPVNSAGTFPAPEVALANMGADPTGDAVGALGQWLDITGLSMSYSNTRIFARLSNAGGGFPTSSGLNFFLYSVGIVDPDGSDSAAYAMIYVSVPLALNSGLYRINPADSSFTRIGNISTSISGNYLHMACNIADLTAQPGWSSWPTPSGMILSAPVTATQSLSGLALNDNGKGCALVPEFQYATYSGNETPNLSLGVMLPQPGSVYASIEYQDPDSDLPVLHQLRLLGQGAYEMTTCELTFGGGVFFTTAVAIDTTGWYQYSFAFSDGVDSVVTTPQAIYLEGAPQFVAGDANGDGFVSISDAVYLITYIFGGGPAPDPLDSGDADCSGIITISDAVYLINYIFAGGPPPCEP